jgi:hypothetical protein
MIRPKELVGQGISLVTVYRRARALNLEKPYKFTRAEVRKILGFRPRGRGKARRPA